MTSVRMTAREVRRHLLLAARAARLVQFAELRSDKYDGDGVGAEHYGLACAYREAAKLLRSVVEAEARV